VLFFSISGPWLDYLDLGSVSSSSSVVNFSRVTGEQEAGGGTRSSYYSFCWHGLEEDEQREENLGRRFNSLSNIDVSI